MIQLALLRQLTVLFLSSTLLVFFLLIERNSAQNSPDSQATFPEFQDSVVWDASSLYKNNDQVNTRMSTRQKRSANSRSNLFVDACQSKMEILTPYYATNSKGKLRTIVNSELMQQAIQVETCIRSPTNQNTAKCNEQLDCGCEQKYKWHRLLVLDPDPRDSAFSRGLFMDWFLFPSSCVCRCKSSHWTTASTKQLLLTTK